MGKKKNRTDAEQGTVVSDGEFPLLASLELYASNTTGDGNCLFRALSDQLYGDESHFREIRSSAVGYIRTHPERFAAFVGEFGETFEAYTKRLMQDAVYGGHLEIVAAAEHFASDIAIYQADQMYVVKPIQVMANKTLHIAYHTWEHYSSVRNKSGPHSGPPKVAPKNGPISIPKEDVPRWKVEIVMRSCPDADEKMVIGKLKTKDYEQVIEELLVEEPDQEPIAELSGEVSVKEPVMEARKPQKRQTAREKRDLARKKALERKLNKNKRKTSEQAVGDQANNKPANKPAVNLPKKTIYI